MIWLYCDETRQRWCEYWQNYNFCKKKPKTIYWLKMVQNSFYWLKSSLINTSSDVETVIWDLSRTIWDIYHEMSYLKKKKKHSCPLIRGGRTHHPIQSGSLWNCFHLQISPARDSLINPASHIQWNCSACFVTLTFGGTAHYSSSRLAGLDLLQAFWWDSVMWLLHDWVAALH